MKTSFLKTLTLFLAFVFSEYTMIAQCKEDPKSIEMLEKKNSVPRSAPDGTWESYDACLKYYSYKCLAENNYYIGSDGKEYPRTQQEAKMIEDVINKIIDNYDGLRTRLGVQGCGDLEPVKAVYADSINMNTRIDKIVGYWITEDKVRGESNYTEFYFGNDYKFNNSLVNSAHEKATWKKIADNKYEITYSSYSTFNKTWSDAEVSTFEINESSCTATYKFTNWKGEASTSVWYYKGGSFNLYGLSREEIITPANCKI